MAFLSTSNSTTAINKGSQLYPYPSHVNAASFVSIKLSGKLNYMAWQEQILCLVSSHDMLGFLDGTLEKPLENDGSKTKVDMVAFETKYSEWKRSDTLVKGWIFGSLSEDVMKTVVGLQTANDVWNKVRTDFTTPPDPTETTISPETAAREKELEYYVPLCRAIQMGDWQIAQGFFNEDKDALTDRLNIDGYTTLHIAIGNRENTQFLENLLDEIDPELLPTLLNTRKENALHYAAMLDNTEAAKKLVEQNPNLLFFADYQKYLPIHRAIINSHRTTFLYLIRACKQNIGLSKKDGCYNPFEGEKGVSLLDETILSGYLDVAYDLLKDYPELARTKVPAFMAPLWCIASMSDAYPSAKRYNFYQRFVYSQVATESNALGITCKTRDIENQERSRFNFLTKYTKSYIYPAIKTVYVNFWNVALLHVPHIKDIHEEKLKHNTALMILKFICEEVSKLKANHYEHYADAFISAARSNTSEIIEQISQTFPESIWTKNIHGYSLAQISIINRCEHVYNFLVHKVTHDKYLHTVLTDEKKNNLLHLVGQLAPNDKLSIVTSAVLQMQRELQWFQEVSKFIRPREREAKNQEGETPIMVFRKEHEDLRQKGEEWIKKTADSYTITAALIITIVFAAAITVPGGNNGATGKAIYQSRPSFIIFIVSNAISLFTSTTSLLLFLSILTARYAVEDFLYKLPKRLILGLVMLFISVTTMMIAFSATLYVSFGQEQSWILIPIATLTCLPIVSFVTLQLPLLVDLISSTYGQGIFGKQSEIRITS